MKPEEITTYKPENLKRSANLSQRIAIAYSASLFILVIAFTVSKIIGEWMWFARSGSILVCIGVLTTSYDIKGKMEKSSAPEIYISQTIVMEASIIIAGTLVWGFGDLLGYIL